MATEHILEFLATYLLSAPLFVIVMGKAIGAGKNWKKADPPLASDSKCRGCRLAHHRPYCANGCSGPVPPKTRARLPLVPGCVS